MNIKKIAIILCANLLFAFGTAYFLVPSGMISGGVTGLALGLDRGFGIPKDEIYLNFSKYGRRKEDQNARPEDEEAVQAHHSTEDQRV